MVFRYPFRPWQQPSVGPHPLRPGRELRVTYRYRLRCRCSIRCRRACRRGTLGGQCDGYCDRFSDVIDSARVTWVGGFELFSDAYVDKPLPSCMELSCDLCTVSLTLISSFCFYPAARNPGMNSLRATSPLGRSRQIWCSASTAQLTTSEMRQSHAESIPSTTISCVLSC